MRLSLIRLYLMLALICAVASGSAYAANPAPLCKQLGWGVFAYGGARLWDNTTQGTAFRNWTADRYKYIFGGNDDKPRVDSLRARNPQMIQAKYELFLRQISDTQEIRQWCDTTPGADFNKIVYHTGPLAGDSINIEVNATGCDPTTCFGAFFQKTPGGNKVVLMPGFNGQIRAMWNEREWQYVGAWLGHKMVLECQAFDANAAFIDEYSHIRKTGANESGLWVNAYPLRDSTSSYWAYNNFRSVTPAWSSSLTHTQIRDSVSKLFIRVMGVVGDSLRAHGIIGFPNGASDFGPYTSTSNWYGEGDTISAALGAAHPGEYCFYYPGTGNEGQYCRSAVTAAYNYRNRGGQFVIMQAGVGLDSSATPPFSINRSKMLCLGFHLEILFSGTTTYGMSLHNRPYNNLYFDYDDRDGSLPGQIEDSTTNWAYAFGKYFGVPNNTRDTSTTVTDLAGNSTRIRVTTLTNPSSGVTQTLSILRYAENNWSRDAAATRAVYTLPGSGALYELNANGTYTAGKNGGDTIHVGNGQARIFVVDTVLANAGVASTPSPASIFVDSIKNDAIGELDTLQTRVTANASIVAGDSVIEVYSLVGFASIDSTDAVHSIRRSLATASTTYTDKFVLTNSETYTLYVAAWHWNTTTGWSTRVQASRTYTAAGTPPVASGTRIKWIRN